MIVYAVSSLDHDVKGIVVNAFGTYANQATTAIVRKLNTTITT